MRQRLSKLQRKAGELLPPIIKRGNPQFTHDELITTLKDLGIDDNQSSRWQLEAEVPEDQFEQYLAETKEKGREVTSEAMHGDDVIGRRKLHGP